MGVFLPTLEAHLKLYFVVSVVVTGVCVNIFYLNNIQIICILQIVYHR